MRNRLDSEPGTRQAVIYQIRLKGHLGCQWSEWFAGLTITLEDNGDTLLSGQVVDQAALYGLLRKVRDLGISLVSVMPLIHDQADACGENAINREDLA